MSSQQTEAYNWKNLLNDFPIGKEVKYEKYVSAGHNSGYETISGKVVGFGIQIKGKDSHGIQTLDFVPIDKVITPPSYNYNLQTGPDGKKVAIINGVPVNLTPKSKSRKSRKTRK